MEKYVDSESSKRGADARKAMYLVRKLCHHYIISIVTAAVRLSPSSSPSSSPRGKTHANPHITALYTNEKHPSHKNTHPICECITQYLTSSLSSLLHDG